MVCDYQDSLIDRLEHPAHVNSINGGAAPVRNRGRTVDGVTDCGTTRMGNWAGC